MSFRKLPILPKINLKKYLILSTLSVGSLSAGGGYDGIWDLNFGYRHDSFKWSVAGQEGFPNIFTELDWDNIHSIQVGTRYILSGWDSIYLRVEGYFGWILQANPIYSVYLENNRQDIFSRQEASRSGDKVYSGKVALGAHLLKCGSPFDLAFLAGYSNQGLRIRWRDAKLLYNQINSPQSVTGLVAKYRPKWNGGFAAIDGSLRWRTYLTFTGSYEVHWTTFRAHGVWNWTQPEDITRITGSSAYYRQEWKDSSTAWGHVFSGSLSYHTSENWYLGLFAYAQYFRSRGAGDYDVIDFNNSSNPNFIYVETFPNNTDNLNPTTWISYYFGVNIECQF